MVLSFGLMLALAAPPVWASAINDFNLIAFGNVTGTSEVEGRTLIFGNISGEAKNFAVKPDAVSAPTSTPGVDQTDGLIIGGQVTGPGQTQVNFGGTRIGGSYTGATINNSDYIRYNDADLSAVLDSVRADVEATDAMFAGLTANSTTDLSDFNNAVFTSTPDANTNIAVFDLDVSFFSRNGTYDIEGDLRAELFLFRVSGATELVTGTALNVFNNEFGDDGFQKRIVWYFPEFEDLTFSNGLGGSLFAPDADLVFGSPMEGTVVAKNVVLNSEIHLPTLDIPTPRSIPPVPEPGTMLLLGFGLIGIAGLSRKKMAAAKKD